MENFAVTCQLVPDVPHLLSGSCSSPHMFGLGFLQTPPRDEALALLLAFGSANTWREDFHLTSSVSCPAHTTEISGGCQPSAKGSDLLSADTYLFYKFRRLYELHQWMSVLFSEHIEQLEIQRQKIVTLIVLGTPYMKRIK